MNIEQLINTAKSTIASAQAALGKFAAAVQENPEHAMMRSNTLFSETASIIVWTEILNNAEGGASLDSIAKTMEEHILYAASNPPHSSSQLSNYLEVEKTRARAQAAKYIRAFAITTVRSSATA